MKIKHVKELCICIFFIIINTISFSLINLTIDKDVVIETIEYYAKSYIVFERESKKILSEKNKDLICGPASLTKILTAIIALENMELDNYFFLNMKDVNVEGSSIYLHEHDLIYGYDLVYGLLLRSGNDCAMSLANIYSYKDFIYKMNELCKRLNLTNSYFINPTGLDGNRTTAYDLAVIYDYCLDNDKFREIINAKKHTVKLVDRSLYLVNKHKLLMYEDDVTGGKTGYTKLCGRTLITSFKRNSKEIIIVTLNASNDWNFHKYLAEIYLGD